VLLLFNNQILPCVAIQIMSDFSEDKEKERSLQLENNYSCKISTSNIRVGLK
jgi:hypothetical protein